MVDGERHIRLADFGLATFAGPQVSTGSTKIAAGAWPPPETFDPNNGEVSKRPTNASDIFAFSAVSWEVRTWPLCKPVSIHESGIQPRIDSLRRTAVRTLDNRAGGAVYSPWLSP